MPHHGPDFFDNIDELDFILQEANKTITDSGKLG